MNSGRHAHIYMYIYIYSLSSSSWKNSVVQNGPLLSSAFSVGANSHTRIHIHVVSYFFSFISGCCTLLLLLSRVFPFLVVASLVCQFIYFHARVIHVLDLEKKRNRSRSLRRETRPVPSPSLSSSTTGTSTCQLILDADDL